MATATTSSHDSRALREQYPQSKPITLSAALKKIAAEIVPLACANRAVGISALYHLPALTKLLASNPTQQTLDNHLSNEANQLVDWLLLSITWSVGEKLYKTAVLDQKPNQAPRAKQCDKKPAARNSAQPDAKASEPKAPSIANRIFQQIRPGLRAADTLIKTLGIIQVAFILKEMALPTQFNNPSSVIQAKLTAAYLGLFMGTLVVSKTQVQPAVLNWLNNRKTSNPNTAGL